METLSHYRLLNEIRRGGMGVVYRALDVTLNREVALKLLPPELVSDPERRARLVREAQAAAALKHPNIAVVYEIGEDNGVAFIAMELIEGEALGDVLSRGPLPAERAVGIALDVARGLGRAHESGVLHRDLKPSNIVLTRDGDAKVIDFGLAKVAFSANEAESQQLTVARNATEPGRIMGTVAYMSPEQARGEKLDARSDIFSFGIVLHELLAGSPPFRAPSAPETLSAIIRERHPPLPSSAAGSKRNGLQRIIDRCLAKSPDERYQSMASLSEALELVRAQGRRGGRSSRWLAAVAAIAASATGLWIWVGGGGAKEKRWARETGLPELQRLVDADEYVSAFSLATRLEGLVPDDPLLASQWPKLSQFISVTTTPEGADIFFRPVFAANSDREILGPSPVDARRVPLGAFWLKVEKLGYDAVEAMFYGIGPYDTPDEARTITVTLEPSGTAPPNMVRVPEGPLSLGGFGFAETEPVDSPSFWIDKLEVTNEDYRKFVDSGGYRNRELWRHEFRDGQRRLDWSDAMVTFRDRTGRPGPSTWEVGSFAEGKGTHPVSGVSWFEAAAYCEFAGKELPTVFHWSTAALPFLSPAIIGVSNFGERGTLPVGSGAPGPHGVHDMAGNVKEWCWNEASGLRYILGGAWSEPTYMYYEADAQSPFDRAETYGFRCARYANGSEDVHERARRPIPLAAPPKDLEPVSDEVFEAYKTLFTFDTVPLEPRVVSVDESNPLWKREKVAFRAAYADEDVIAYLFLPTSTSPPFQTVVYFPGASAQEQRSPEELQTRMIDFLVLSGRAVLYPIYKGTHERRLDEFPREDSRDYADYVTYLMSDLRRSVDYLATRDDIQIQKLGYYGFSWGARFAPIALALEPRISTAVLLDGGLVPPAARPEAREENYASRVVIPILMINGSFDARFPLESSQKFLFQLLGTPAERKQHILYPSGHAVFVRYRNQAIENILDWFDRYLGPTK